MQNVLRSILSPGISAVRINSDVNLIRRCLDYRECKGVSALRHYGTCALVGSSGILLNSSCGDDIDASDFVIRFNLSPQEGYTKDVGKKSSMMVLNTLMSHKAYDLFNTTGGNREARLRDMFRTADNAILFFPVSKSNRFWWMYRGLEQILRRQGLNVVVVMGVTTFEHGHDEIRRKIWEVLDKQNTREMPSTGLLLVEIAITFCDRIQVYGFYPFARDQQDHAIPFYYWDTPDSDLGAGHIHNFAAEFELLRKLHSNGVIEHKIGHCK
ncbi:PREDICTED: alpha-2,8-sialyltransferase 8B-like [Branchiostoma belcheri]|uniref:Alpha-2,8-sialyltransferase 8B-like n=1 Tax=Branchiostoma belcheri TaxID=7741 RepID=A0A6P4Z680_BRABE|nr:PREDICTED: alpha-2,8-sialyltransferase 8B-like [Branchiostoma belcheri]